MINDEMTDEEFQEAIDEIRTLAKEDDPEGTLFISVTLAKQLIEEFERRMHQHAH